MIRWLCDLVRLRRRRVGRPHERRRDGEHHGPHRRSGRAPGEAPRHRGAAARRTARRRTGLRLRPDPLLGRAGRRPPRLPGGHAQDRALGRRVPPAGRTGRGRRSPRTAPPGSRRSPSAPSPARRTRARSTTSRRSPTSPNGKVSGSMSTLRTARPPGSRRARPHKLPGLERADSLTVDPHKWLFQPYDIGGLLVKRREDLLRTFHREPEYYAVWGPEERPLHWYQYSLEGTRRFRALKLWLSWKHLGSDGFATPDRAQRRPRSCISTSRAARTGLRGDRAGARGRLPAARTAPTRPPEDRRAPAAAPAGPGGVRRRVALDHDASRPNLAARGRDQLPLDGGRRGSDPRHPVDASRTVHRRPRRVRSTVASAHSNRSRHLPASPAASPVSTRLPASRRFSA